LTESGSYEFAIAGSPGELVLDPTPVLASALDDVAAGVSAPRISMRFHRSVVGAIVTVAEEAGRLTGIKDIVLGGGVFMNRIVLGEAMRQLEEVGLKPMTHLKLPMNDAAVSFGQAVSAWARRHEI
jgi:hydrogenase maturation protein HypF